MSTEQKTPELMPAELPPTPLSDGSKKPKPVLKKSVRAAGSGGKVSSNPKLEAMLWDIVLKTEKIDFDSLWEKHGYKSAKSMRDSFYQLKTRYLASQDDAGNNDDADEEANAAPERATKRKVAKEDNEEAPIKKQRKPKAKPAAKKEPTED